MDKLPTILRCGYYIMNSQIHTLPGQHWIAMNVGRHTINLFDPFGFFYPGPLVNRLTSTGKIIKFNYRKYQKFLSTNCGEICIMWLKSQYKQ